MFCSVFRSVVNVLAILISPNKNSPLMQKKNGKYFSIHAPGFKNIQYYASSACVAGVDSHKHTTCYMTKVTEDQAEQQTVVTGRFMQWSRFRLKCHILCVSLYLSPFTDSWLEVLTLSWLCCTALCHNLNVKYSFFHIMLIYIMMACKEIFCFKLPSGL